MAAGRRDRYLDLVRGSSIVAVVLGHWLVADLSWDGQALHQRSALGQVPQLWPLTWVFQVIPLFFLVAGSANRRSWRSAEARGEGFAAFVDRRLHRVLAPTAVFLGLLLPLAVVADAAAGWGLRGGGAMLLQPLWFLAVYLVVVALTPVTVGWHERFGWGVPAGLLAVAVVADVVRIGAGQPWAGYLNVLTVWLLVYQLGYLEADGRLSRRTGAAMLAGGLAATTLLVWLGPYPARMVGVPGDRIANMHPPTLALTGLAVAEVGLMVLLRRRVEPLLDRERVWRAVVRLNLSIMTIFLWHQVAFVASARLVLPHGWPDAVAGSLRWWLGHLGLVLVSAVVLALLVLALGRFERVAPPPPAPQGAAAAGVAVLGVGLVALGLLALAGTRVTEPWAAVDVLAGLVAGPVAGVVLVAAGGAAMRSLRRGRPARGAGGAGVLLGVTALGYAAGAGPLPQAPGVAGLLAGLGVVAGVVAGVVGVRRAASAAPAARPPRDAPSSRAGGR